MLVGKPGIGLASSLVLFLWTNMTSGLLFTGNIRTSDSNEGGNEYEKINMMSSSSDMVETKHYRNASIYGRQLASQSGDDVQYVSVWTYACTDSVCKKQFATGHTKISLDVCWLTCGKYGALWPFPTIRTNLGYETTPFYPHNVEVVEIKTPNQNQELRAMLGYAGNIFLDALFKMHPQSQGQAAFPISTNGRGYEKNRIAITLAAYTDETRLSLTTDESYSLRVSTIPKRNSGSTVRVVIEASTYYGIRHGLESVGQLMAYDTENECLQVVSTAFIEDRPAFKYRGVMVDTARNFIPVPDLRRVVDAMSYNKLNVLHLHLTDSNSFPFFSKRIPQMTMYGAYSASQIYSPKAMKDLVLYARLRGVKLIPELDAPSHAGNGWQWGEIMGLGPLALCVNAQDWRNTCGQPPCGQLNPLNNFTYMVLGELYKDFLDVFDNDIFHIGGDEVSFACWNSRVEIREWLRSRGTSDLMELWGEFQTRAYQKLIEANGGQYITPIVWTSDMTSRARQYLRPQDYVIQIWTGATNYEVRELLQENYRLIFSNLDSLYLDHGFGSWLGKDHFYTYKTWQNIYDNDLIKIVEHHIGANATFYAISSKRILGAEAVLWSEKVDKNNMHMKLWPRSSALGERLWSSPQNRTITVAARLAHHAQRMASRGIFVDRLQPESCQQLEGYCHDPYSPL